MEIDVTEDGTIRFKKVFNSIVLESEDGEQLAVCMRDTGFEVKYGDSWISMKEGKLSGLSEPSPMIFDDPSDILSLVEVVRAEIANLNREKGDTFVDHGLRELLESFMRKIRLAERRQVAGEVMKLCLDEDDSVNASCLYRAILNPKKEK